jgi:hypothetical protein
LCHEVVVRGAGVGGCLLNQLAKVFPCNGDLVVDVSDIR